MASTTPSLARLEAAGIVARYWRDSGIVMGEALVSHPSACILTAIEGELNPVELGIPEDSPEADQLRKIQQRIDSYKEYVRPEEARSRPLRVVEDPEPDDLPDCLR